MKCRIYVLPLLILLAGCGRWWQGGAEGSAAKIPDYRYTLQSAAEFKKLEGSPLSDKFSHVRSVKVLYDIQAKTMYFINGKRFTYHHEFAERILYYRQGMYVFNEHNYSAGKNKRDFLLGNLNHLGNTGTWFLELSPSDQMDPDLIQQFYSLLKQNCIFCDSLRFYVNSQRLLDLEEQGSLNMPVIRSESLFGTLSYQQVSAGKITGILKRYTLEELKTSIPGRDEIIVLNGTPLVLPDVRGVIVTELQTPLSHLVLLGRNRKIPIVALTEAWEHEELARLYGQTVELETRSDTMYLKAVDALAPAVVKQRRIVPECDLSVKGLVMLNKVPVRGQRYIGSKAWNFACLAAISRRRETFYVPEYAFAIPFWYYAQHMEKSGALAMLAKLKPDSPALKDELKAIRLQITNHPVDAELLSLVQARMDAQTEFNAFRFRSSTNAEDLEGFNGAGLYDSGSARKGDTLKTIEAAIRKVWASAWSLAAYNERELFGIDQRTVAMGILVHRSFPEEEANGVLITKDLYRDYDGITVNIQKGESSVVLPEKGIHTEIFTAYPFDQSPWNGQLITDYVSHSPLNNYRPVLSDAELRRLYRAAMDVESGMQLYWGRQFDCDIEFKLIGAERRLYFKQVRVY